MLLRGAILPYNNRLQCLVGMYPFQRGYEQYFLDCVHCATSETETTIPSRTDDLLCFRCNCFLELSIPAYNQIAGHLYRQGPNYVKNIDTGQKDTAAIEDLRQLYTCITSLQIPQTLVPVSDSDSLGNFA